MAHAILVQFNKIALRVRVTQRDVCQRSLLFPKWLKICSYNISDLFPNELSRRHFAEYLTGLFIAEHKTVSGITCERT